MMTLDGNIQTSLVVTFDGDEMNLHAPQSQGARVECSTICRTWFHMVSAQNNAPVMGCVQNTLLCFYYITETFSTPEEVNPSGPNYKFADGTDGYQTMIDLSDFMDSCVKADISFDRMSDLARRVSKHYPEYVYLDEENMDHEGNGVLRFADKLPGKIVASIVFPRDFTWSRKTDVNDKLPIVSIKDGVILPDSGPLCKKSIGGVAGSAIHPLWKGLNDKNVTDGPKQAADLISELQFMMTVLMPRIGFSMGMSDCLPTGEAEKMVRNSIRDTKVKCEIVRASNKSDEDKEIEINGILNEATSVAQKLAKTGMNKKDRNALVVMEKSGAKGSKANIGQIAGLVGQQNLGGARIPFCLSNETRALPHFLPYDNSPEARGFIENSYTNGLTYTEQWFHAKTGRRGVIDTALKTSDSGYIQKRIVNAIADLKTWYDGTTRNATGSVVQFAYGGDMMNAKELMNTKGIDYPVFMNFIVAAECLNSKAELNIPLEQRGMCRKLTKDEINILVTNGIQAGIPGCQTGVTEMITYNMKCVVRAAVADVMLYECMIPKFCKTVKDEFERAKVKNGYMAGIVASCSIGEPTTQLTLNSVDWNSIVLVRIDGEDTTNLSEGGVFIGPIGEIIDRLIEKADVITTFPENNTEYVDVMDLDAHVTCVDEKGKMHWKRLEAVTRHLPGGKLVKVKTRMGREVSVTRSKSMLVRVNNRIVEKAGSDMKVGDYVPVVINSPVLQSPLTVLDVDGESLILDRSVGYSFGYYVSHRKLDSYREKPPKWTEQLGLIISQKLIEQNEGVLVGSGTLGSGSRIPCWSLICCLSFVEGYLDAFFTYNSKLLENNDIECECGHPVGAQHIAEMCSRFGIFAKIAGTKVVLFSGFAKKFVRCIMSFLPEQGHEYEDKAGNPPNGGQYQYGGPYDTIPGVVTDSIIGDVNREYLKQMLTYNTLAPQDYANIVEAVASEVFFDEVISIEEIESSTEKVYDFTVADTRNFNILGGLCVRDTFHYAGNSAKDVTLGVPRFVELLNASGRLATPGRPSKAGSTIYLKNAQLNSYLKKKNDLKALPILLDDLDKNLHDHTAEDIDSASLHLVAEIASSIGCLYVEDIIKSHEFQYLPTEDGKPRKSSPLELITYEEYEPKWWVTLKENLSSPSSFKADAWVILLTLDMYKLYERGITTEQVATDIEENSFGSKGYALACVASPNTIGQIEIYLNFTEIGEHARSQVDMPLGEKVSRYLVSPENIEFYAMREVALNLIRKTQIQGVHGITKTYVRQTPNGEWVVDTKGTNLMTMLGLPNIDSTRTISDNMWEIYNVLGIEATRKFLIKEITKILSFDGTYINSRHICLLVDGMVRQGTINSVNRDGIPRDIGPIAKGMFEKAVDNFAEAAAFAEHDEMKGVAASVMFGTLAEVGTGLVEIKDSETLPLPVATRDLEDPKEDKILQKPQRPAIKVPVKPKKR
jgi:DNA-directed RNA polymerase beta' subunit